MRPIRCSPLRRFFRTTRIWTLALLAAAPQLASCGVSEERAPPRPTEAECPPGSTLTYVSFGRELFGRYCDGCHAQIVTGVQRMGAPSTVTFDDPESIREKLDLIDQLAAAGPAAFNTDMPRGSGPIPTAEERFKLGEWLACGAP